MPNPMANPTPSQRAKRAAVEKASALLTNLGVTPLEVEAARVADALWAEAAKQGTSTQAEFDRWTDCEDLDCRPVSPTLIDAVEAYIDMDWAELRA